MIAREQPNYTPKQVRQHLEDALEIVDDLNVPAELRATAYGKAVDLLAAKRIALEQTALLHYPQPRVSGL